MSITTFSVAFPDELVKDAKEAAETIGTDLETFIIQATFARVQRLPAMLAKPITAKNGSKERRRRDEVWIEQNYQTLIQKYPDQWVYVYNQKVVAADRRALKAERLARVAIEEFDRDAPAEIFVEASRYGPWSSFRSLVQPTSTGINARAT